MADPIFFYCSNTNLLLDISVESFIPITYSLSLSLPLFRFPQILDCQTFWGRNGTTPSKQLVFQFQLCLTSYHTLIRHALLEVLKLSANASPMFLNEITIHLSSSGKNTSSFHPSFLLSNSNIKIVPKNQYHHTPCLHGDSARNSARHWSLFSTKFSLSSSSHYLTSHHDLQPQFCWCTFFLTINIWQFKKCEFITFINYKLYIESNKTVLMNTYYSILLPKLVITCPKEEIFLRDWSYPLFLLFPVCRGACFPTVELDHADRFLWLFQCCQDSFDIVRYGLVS